MTAPSSDSSNSRVQSTGSLILIVNDDEWTARSLQSILESEGHRIALAFTGHQALQRAAGEPPDLVLLDVQLPDIPGPEVCLMLRRDPRVGLSTPIIITTAGGDARLRQAEALAAGAWDFHTQPFDGPTLLSKIRRFLEVKEALDEAERGRMLDPATAGYTRQGLVLRVGEALADAHRRRERLVCLVLSVSGSDPEHVEEAGQFLGTILRAGVRTSDIVGQLSPSNCVVLAPNLGRQDSAGMLERLRQEWGAKSGAVETLRVGFTTAESTEPEGATRVTPEELLRRAASVVESGL